MLSAFTKVLAATLLCFGVSWAAAAVGGLNNEKSYPESVTNRYLVSISNGRPVNFSREIDARGVLEVEIDTVATDIVVERGGEKVVASLKGSFPDGDERSLVDEVRNGKLSLRTVEETEKGNWQISMGAQEAELRVRVPTGVAKLTVKTISGDFLWTEGAFQEVSAQTTSGDVVVKRAKVGGMELKSVSGDLLCKDCEISRLDGKTVSGDILLTLENNSPSLELKTTSGDIAAKFSKKPDLNLEFSSVSGDVRVDPELAKVEEGSGRTSVKLGNGKGTLNAKSVSGDLIIGRF